VPSLIESLKAERKITAESVRIVGRLRLSRALVFVCLSLDALAVFELHELGVKARKTAQRPRVALGIGRALCDIAALRIGAHTLLQMDEPLVERFEQPADDVAAANLLDGRALCLGLAWPAWSRSRPEPLGPDEPHPTMLLGALNERALAHSMGVSDALQRPVAMDEVMLDALPVGRSGLDLIGNLLRPRRFFPLPLWERVAPRAPLGRAG
jgi:hypothetical protein